MKQQIVEFEKKFQALQSNGPINTNRKCDIFQRQVIVYFLLLKRVIPKKDLSTKTICKVTFVWNCFLRFTKNVFKKFCRLTLVLRMTREWKNLNFEFFCPVPWPRILDC